MKVLCARQKNDMGEPAAEWLAARTARITASRVADVLSYLKPTKAMLEKGIRPEESQKRKDYCMEILCERLTLVAAEHFVSKPMKFGADYEDEARRAYELKTEWMVDQTGFVLHPSFDFAGASPDGLVGTEGGLEVKVPNTATHLEYLLADVVPEEYRPQMYFNMTCCELAWMDFCSYDPRLPEPLRLFVKRLHYDEDQCAKIDEEVISFNESIEASIAALKARFGDFRLPEAQAQPMLQPISDEMLAELGALDEDIASVERMYKQSGLV
jgi:predicted phage-related endonuclease